MDFLIRWKRTSDRRGAYPRYVRMLHPRHCRENAQPNLSTYRYDALLFRKSNAARNIDSAPIFSAPSSRKNLGE